MLSSYRPLKAVRSTTTLALIFCCAIIYLSVSYNLLSPFITRPETAAPATVPKRIWYKLGPKGLSDEARAWTDTCITNNTGYQVEFMTDLTSDDYVRRTFAHHPDLVDRYLSLPIPILKADLLRYLLLFAEGGVWFDLDVTCEGVPIDDWIHPQYDDDANLIVGWEFDAGWGENITRQFASWTIMAKPALPHIWTVVEDILEAIGDTTAKYNVTIHELTLDMIGDVVDFTGPRRFTRSVLKSLERSLNATLNESSFSNILEPKLVGDILVLPGYAFAASANTYNEQDKEVMGPPLVKHHYAGSWKNSNGGELLR